MSGYIEDYVMYTHVYFLSTIKKIQIQQCMANP
jgi:hypothetical protein